MGFDVTSNETSCEKVYVLSYAWSYWSITELTYLFFRKRSKRFRRFCFGASICSHPTLPSQAGCDRRSIFCRVKLSCIQRVRSPKVDALPKLKKSVYSTVITWCENWWINGFFELSNAKRWVQNLWSLTIFFTSPMTLTKIPDKKGKSVQCNTLIPTRKEKEKEIMVREKEESIKSIVGAERKCK